MADHVHTEGFCRTCHCRRIAITRTTPEYFAKRQAGFNRWADGRAGIALESHERPMIRVYNRQGINAINARKIIARSRRAADQGEQSDGG